MGVGFDGPGLAQFVENIVEWSLGGVPVSFCGGEVGGVGWAEVGSVAAEDGDPLLAGVLEGLGDQVGDVVVPAPGHADVGRCGAAVLTDHDVGGAGGVALSAVDGAGVGEFDVGTDVVRRQGAFTVGAGEGQAAVGVRRR